MAKWEYSVITINTEYEVPFDGKIEDRMGAAGWELATFLPAMPMPQKWKGNEFANPWMYHAVFKRRVED